MPAQRDCPGIDSLQALFGDGVPPDRRASYERHLESCPACQDRLDRAEECEDEVRCLGRRVGDPTAVAADPSLARFLTRMHDAQDPGRTSAAEPVDLYFLRPADDPDLLGTLGAYEVRELIGQGGMGIVLKAFEPALHRLVAIKVLSPALAGSATARQRFTRETQAAAAVCHDHIVAVYGVAEADGLPYLVMQYVAGESLQSRLDRAGPLEVVEAVRIGHQAASGLAAAHAQGLIHRDIKPANLLLENGLAKVKITDFGLARMIDDVGLTQQGVLAGTPEYMAPEQARGEPVDHRADLFALGAVLYACCTGRPPFRASTAVGVLRRVIDEAPAPVHELNPDIPAWLEAAIGRLLAKDPAQRFQSAAEVAALLEGYLAHLRQPATVPAPELSPLRTDTKLAPCAPGLRAGAVRWLRRPLRVAAVMLLGVAGLGTAWWLAAGAGETAAPARPPQEYVHSFQGDSEIADEFRFDGLDPEQCVRFEPAGLRLTLPAGHPGKRMGTGLATAFPVKGDFDITLGFEILKEPDPADAGLGTGVYLWVDLDAPAVDRAMLFRVVEAEKRFAEAFYLSPKGPDKQPAGEQPEWGSGPPLPTAALRGRLRLVRTGSTLSYLVAEDSRDEFRLVCQHPFGTEDVREVRLGGLTGGPDASLDARFTDLRIRAEALPGAPAGPVAPHQGAGGKRWLAVGLTLGLLSTVALILAVRLARRRRGRAGTVPAPVPARGGPATAPAAGTAFSFFPCAGCGKTLKARAEMAGRKVKCRHCAQVVLVPQAAAGESPGRSS